jgi:hypothetical protein
MNKGFVVIAQNTTNVNYIQCAEMLALSLKNVMPNASVSLISDDVEHSKYFDYVIALPHGDLAKDSEWKLINDWQVYEASPYDYTIKLEADMYIPVNIDYWWDILEQKEVVVCSTIRDYKNNISKNKFYRSFIYNNNLPDVYNAITYFKKGELASKFFGTVRFCFENWEHLKPILKCNVDEQATTDWVYAISCMIHGIENTTLPNFDAFSMIHMKQYINDLICENWTSELVYEINKNCIRLNTFPQLYPFHYHIKNFSCTIANELT